jgi:hypothetical protein
VSGGLGVWTYAIARGGSELSGLTGVGGATVRTTACAGLTALVSDVSLAEFGEEALRENLENLDWLDVVARAHHDVIDAASRLFELLPTRLATVYSGDAALCAALAARRDQLLDTLHRVGGRAEWGVKAYAAPDPDPPDPPDQVRGRAGPAVSTQAGGAGLDYLKRRRAQLTAERDSRGAAMNGARAVHAGLSGQAEAARLHPPQAAQLRQVRLPMLLNAAYLLPAADGASFAATVAAEASAHPELRIELTGPWPPYSFVGDDDGGRR